MEETVETEADIETEIVQLKYGECSQYEEILNAEEPTIEQANNHNDIEEEEEEEETTEHDQNSEEHIERNTFLNHLSSLKLGATDTNATTLTYRTHSFSQSEDSEQTDVSSMSDADIPMLDILKRYMEEHCADNDDEYDQVLDLFANLADEEYDTESIFYDIENALQSNIHNQCEDSVYWELS